MQRRLDEVDALLRHEARDDGDQRLALGLVQPQAALQEALAERLAGGERGRIVGGQVGVGRGVPLFWCFFVGVFLFVFGVFGFYSELV